MNSSGTPPASRFLGVLIACFVLLGIGYGALTPIFENSDETLHYPYVKRLADGQGLPLAIPGQLWNQEGTQPPLYYTIVAASTFWIDTDNLAEQLQRNPHWRFTEVRALINDNQNLVLHGPMDAFPYSQTALAVHIGRWWSLAFGLVTVICTFLIGRYLFPGNPFLVVTATALTALNPQFIRVSATVSNDSLSAALASLTVLLALKFTATARGSLTPYRFSDRHAVLLGLLAGLALLTKLSSLTVLGLVALIIFGRLFFVGELHDRPLQKVVRWLIVMGLTAAFLSGWWFGRNYLLYGEWLATETHLNLAGRSPLSLAEVWRLRLEAERAYWATFGWGQIRPPEWVYGLLFLFSRVGLVGLGLALLVKLVQGDRRGPVTLSPGAVNFGRVGLLLVWAAFNLALYLRWVMEVGSVSHTRLLFPAITAISLLLALGWHAALPRRLDGRLSGLVTAALLALNIYSLGWLIYPAFTPPPDPNEAVSHDQFLVEATVETSDLTFLDSMRLIYGAAYNPDGFIAEASPGDLVIISAWWETLKSMDRNYSVSAVLLAPDGQVLARRETYPGLGLRPTGYLQPGDSFLDLYPLRLEEAVTAPVVARVVVHLFDFDSDTRAGFPALDAAGQVVTPVVDQIKITPRPWPSYQPAVSARVNFGDAIALTGYDWNRAGLEGNPQTEAGLTLYWEALDRVGQDYVLFLHLLDGQGRVVGQADAPVTQDAYPTSWWAPGEVIADRHIFSIPPEVSALRFGLYRLDSGERLPVLDSTLPVQDNGVEVARP